MHQISLLLPSQWRAGCPVWRLHSVTDEEYPMLKSRNVPHCTVLSGPGSSGSFVHSSPSMLRPLPP
jgi:hypothetical protein